MLVQIFVGTFLIGLTFLVKAAFIGRAITFRERTSTAIQPGTGTVRQILVTTLVTVWIVGALSVAVWVWAAALLILGQFSGIEEALYFSFVAFTTLGFGDVLLSEEWRLLSGFIAANGLILFSLATAFLMEAIRGMRSR